MNLGRRNTKNTIDMNPYEMAVILAIDRNILLDKNILPKKRKEYNKTTLLIRLL